MPTADKILDWPALLNQVQTWQSQGLKVVFTNGCFDIIHLGHVDYLEKARQKGDKLVLGLNTDESVQRLKGTLRPIVPQQARARVLAAFEFIDGLTFFEEDTPLRLIETLQPDILTKGSDYTIENIIGADFVLKNGGSVETLDLVEGFSTSNIIEKIKNYYI